jgi:4-hydroxy-tetrahydrodipicolinate reductase
MTVRVVHWGTGNTGKLALRGVLQHPDLELVGLYVHSPDKVGRDAGELIGRDATGVIATNDVDKLLAIDADCLCYLGDGIGPRAAGAVDEMSRFLRAGRNVVSTSLNQLVNPKTAADDLRVPLEEACRAGGTSFFNNGADPGFGSDLIPLTLLALMDDIDSVRIQEIVNYSHYDQSWVMRDLFGFGQPLDYQSPLFASGALTEYWGGVVTMIADALRLELDEIREVHEFASVAVDVDVEIGRIDAGSIAAIRFEVQGIVGGEPVIVIEHDTRIHDDAAPDWPQCRGGDNCYRVLIEGRPKLTCELDMEDEHGGDGGLIACSMRVVNAIPAVCAAPPGLLSTLDVPPVFGRNVRLRRSSST